MGSCRQKTSSLNISNLCRLIYRLFQEVLVIKALYHSSPCLGVRASSRMKRPDIAGMESAEICARQGAPSVIKTCFVV